MVSKGETRKGFNEEFSFEIGIALVYLTIDSKDNMSSYLLTTLLLAKLTKILSWISNLNFPIFYPLSKPFAILSPLILIGDREIFLSKDIVVCVANQERAFPWSDNLTIGIQKPTLLPSFASHLICFPILNQL